MNVEYAIRRLAGTLVLVGLGLGYFYHPGWFFLVAFVGINLIQSTFTGFCPAETIFKKLGLGRASAK